MRTDPFRTLQWKRAITQRKGVTDPLCPCGPSLHPLEKTLRAHYGPTLPQRNDHTDASTQSWTFMVLRPVLVNGPITALAAASPRRNATIFGRRTSGPCGGRKEGRSVLHASVGGWPRATRRGLVSADEYCSQSNRFLLQSRCVDINTKDDTNNR